MIPVAARIAATISTATPSGFPQDAPNSKVVATASTVMLMIAEQEAGQQLPAEDRGPADRGGQQPGQRPVVALLEQAGHAELDGEEQEEHGHPRGEERLLVELLGLRGHVADRHRRRGRGRPRRRAPGSARAAAARRIGGGHGGDRQPDPVQVRGVALGDRPGDLGGDGGVDVADDLHRGGLAGLDPGGEAGRDDDDRGQRSPSPPAPGPAATVGSGWMAISPLRPTAGRTWPVNCWLTAP